MVSFVPPLPGTSDGGEKRTLPRAILTAVPGASGAHVPVHTACDRKVSLGKTRVMVPSGSYLLEPARLPIVLKKRAAPWNTPVVP